jgi:cytochrome c oxidase subunit III
MSSDARAAHLADHFPDAEAQLHAARLGMWIFLATEILLFAGIFIGYTFYRSLYPLAFREGSAHLDQTLGTVNTLVLITSSFTVAIAVSLARAERGRLAAATLGLTILLGAAFLAVKAFEYAHKLEEGALPGRYFRLDHAAPGANVFFTVYWLSTSLHAIHVTAGLGVLAWMAWRCWRTEFSSEYFVPIENAGLYWHLVDLVWIFLFPLLYLA